MQVVKGRRISVEYTFLRPDSEEVRQIVATRSYYRYDNEQGRLPTSKQAERHGSEERVS